MEKFVKKLTSNDLDLYRIDNILSVRHIKSGNYLFFSFDNKKLEISNTSWHNGSHNILINHDDIEIEYFSIKEERELKLKKLKKCW